VDDGSIAGDRKGRAPNGWSDHRSSAARRHCAAILFLLAPIASPLAAAEDVSDAWKTFGDRVDSTTPSAIASPEARDEGPWHGLWDGTKRIWNEGAQDIYVSGYFYHAPYGFSRERRDEFNDNAWGGGYGRTLTEDNLNQRMLYGIIATDSHRKRLYLAGYAWLARWPFIGGLRVGAGYSALLISHSTSTNYWPVPLLAPVASIGTDNAAIYATYFNSIGYFFTKLSFGQ
jgi:palmitoyl transferase